MRWYIIRKQSKNLHWEKIHSVIKYNVKPVYIQGNRCYLRSVIKYNTKPV